MQTHVFRGVRVRRFTALFASAVFVLACFSLYLTMEGIKIDSDQAPSNNQVPYRTCFFTYKYYIGLTRPTRVSMEK